MCAQRSIGFSSRSPWKFSRVMTAGSSSSAFFASQARIAASEPHIDAPSSTAVPIESRLAASSSSSAVVSDEPNSSALLCGDQTGLKAPFSRSVSCQGSPPSSGRMWI